MLAPIYLGLLDLLDVRRELLRVPILAVGIAPVFLVL
jgi:hypothetical protein